MTSQLVVEPLPAFADNYIWTLRRRNHTGVWVVDPGDAAPVRQWLEINNYSLAGILITHHHPDHVGGVPALAGPDTLIFGPARQPLELTRTPVAEGDKIAILDEVFDVLDIPGHTENHIGFYAHPAQESPLLFCGDTLFSAGCGRLLGGTAEQLHGSLGRLARLPGDTRVFCTHEYTLANLEFAQTVEPGNSALRERHRLAEAQRARGEPTLPVRLGAELDYNPFLRCAQPSVQQAVATHYATQVETELETFTRLRAWKDSFRPGRKSR